MIVKTRNLNAVVLRIILCASLFIIIAVVVAGFTFAHQVLTEYAISVGKKNIDAQSSDTTIQSLTVTEKQLSNYAQARDDASKLRLADNHPEFTVREILNRIAKKNNISIGISSSSSGSATTTPQGQQTAPAGTTATPTPAASSPTGKTFKLSVSVKPESGTNFDRNNYVNFLQFLRDLEQSLPKIKVDGVDVSGGGSGTSSTSTPNNGQPAPPQTSSNTISINSINLEIYIK